MGIYVDLSGWKPKYIDALQYIAHNEPCDDNDITDNEAGAIARQVTEALVVADPNHEFSYVEAFAFCKEATHNDCGNVDAFVAELEVLMQYANIPDVVTVYYSPNEEGNEAGSGWAVVNNTCGLGGALWSNALLMEHAMLLYAEARIYVHQALIMSLPYVHHIASEGHLLVVNDASKRVYVITPGHAVRWYVRSASSALAYATGSDGAAGPDFATLEDALAYCTEEVTKD